MTVYGTLIIDHQKQQYAVYRNGEFKQRTPIHYPRTVPHIRGFFKKLGYEVIEIEREEEMTSPAEVNRGLYQALLRIATIKSLDGTHHKTEGALRKRGFIKGEEITDAGLRFIDEYTGTISAPVLAPSIAPLEAEGTYETAADDHHFDTGDALAVVNEEIRRQRDTLAIHVADLRPQSQPDHTRAALIDLREASLSLIETVIAQKAPEVLPALAAVRRADSVLLGDNNGR
jgi:hypothetical protein